MRIVLISTLTGLLAALWLHLALLPYTPTRFTIYGILFIATVLTGLRATDRIRHQQGMWTRR